MIGIGEFITNVTFQYQTVSELSLIRVSAILWTVKWQHSITKTLTLTNCPNLPVPVCF